MADRAIRRLLWPALAGALLAACSGDGETDNDPTLAPPPELDAIRRVVIVGDSAASNPTYASNVATLLVSNDDTTFPAFSGRDLSTRLPGAEVIRLARGADSYHALAAMSAPICTCDAPCADVGECVDTSVDTPTLVIVSLGLNDLFDAIIQLTLGFAQVDDPQPLLDQLRAQTASVLAYFNDPANFPTRPLIVVTTPYDPSDGVGDMGDLVAMAYPIIPPGFIPQDAVQVVFDAFVQIVREEAEVAGAVLVDSQQHFLGHGYHFDDPSLPHHDAADETIWIQNLFEPTLRGAHELRRLIWNELTGAPIDALPGPLPSEDLTLPAVPDAGWANAVASSALTMSYTDGEGKEWSNVAADPSVALGPPGMGSAASVAIGILDASFVLDLGAGEEAFDGPGHDLVIMEYGPTTGGTPEPYRVLVSDSASGPFIPLADGRGERAFDLASAGVTSARYVRIDSQAHIVDVMSGFGSPQYPGPEINAVGAVYPGAAP